MEVDFWRGVSGTAMPVLFGLGGGPTTVSRISVTALYLIMTLLFVSLYMFAVCLFNKNFNCLGQQLADMIRFMPMSIYKGMI